MGVDGPDGTEAGLLGTAARHEERFAEALAVYRDQLGDDDFGVWLEQEVDAGANVERGLTLLHSSAAEHFQRQAQRYASRADAVDAYEQGAYGDPPVNGTLLGIVLTATLGFSFAVIVVYGIVGVVLMVMSLCVDVVLVRMWRRPPYRYTGEYRQHWEHAASVAVSRAERAKRGLFPTQ